MKILPVDKIHEADAYTIENEPIASIDLMERAGTNCYEWIKERLASDQKVMVFAGIGNNAGDGLVIARLLAADDVEVEIVLLQFSDKFSNDFSTNLNRLQEQNKVKITPVKSEDQIPAPDADDVVIDAIFGSGLTRPVKGLPGKAIQTVNNSEAVVVAIDIPSGMYADHPIDEKEGNVIHADHTLSLQLPKLSMMMPSTADFVGELSVIPIGLHPDFMEQVDTPYHVIMDEFKTLLPQRTKFSHKGDYGHALIMAGSYGKMGACVLCSRASLRSGAGLVTAHVPKKGYNIIQTAVPECMTVLDPDQEIQANLPDLSPYNVIAIGPGIGTSTQTQKLIKVLIQEANSPLVFDADALNILAENKTWFSFLPANSVLTPHPGEFDRMAGKCQNGFERIEKAREFAKKFRVYIVLKGAYTAVCTPLGHVWFNSTGNPGMATGGSGDVLTGIIAGFLAQRMKPFDAASLGVFVHGIAGDNAADELGEEALIASDIIEHLPDAFELLSEG